MFDDFPALSNRRPELIDRISESYPGKVFGSVMAYIGSITITTASVRLYCCMT